MDRLKDFSEDRMDDLNFFRLGKSPPCFVGTSFAITFPRRVMIISSPVSTLFNRELKLVRTSFIFTVCILISLLLDCTLDVYTKKMHCVNNNKDLG